MGAREGSQLSGQKRGKEKVTFGGGCHFMESMIDFVSLDCISACGVQ